MDACQTNKGKGQTGAAPAPIVEEPVSAQGTASPKDGTPAQEPLPIKPASWWRPFIFGGALIPKADAVLAVRMILSELRVTVDERVLDFQTDQIVQTTFCEALEKLTGSWVGGQ